MSMITAKCLNDAICLSYKGWEITESLSRANKGIWIKNLQNKTCLVDVNALQEASLDKKQWSLLPLLFSYRGKNEWIFPYDIFQLVKLLATVHFWDSDYDTRLEFLEQFPRKL